MTAPVTFAAGAPPEAHLTGRIAVSGRRFVDDLGREVLLRGVNLGSKRAADGFLPPHSSEDVARLVRATGANLARLYVAWRALEPEPGRLSEAYADGIRRHAERLTRHGLHVLVDFHQDVWGGPFAEHGAPDWATLGPGTGRECGGSWLLGYLNPPVYRSFQALWENRRVPATGLGLQDHMARAWAFLARRLASLDGLLGYDLLNEPFSGREIEPALLRIGVRNLPELAWVLARALPTIARRPRSAVRVLLDGLRERFRSPRRLDRLLRSARDLNGSLEPRLLRLVRRVARAIREVDTRGIIGVEPPTLAGTGVPTTWSEGARSAALDPIRPCAYLPHLYDAVLELDGPYDGRVDRVRTALGRHAAVAEALDLPLLVGEWGFLRASVGDVRAFARDVRGELDDVRASAAYWEHDRGFTDPDVGEDVDPAERLGFLEASAPYPRRIAGRLTELSWDAEARTLRFAYDVSRAIDGPTVIAFPDRLRDDAGLEVTVTPAAGSRVVIPPSSGLVLVHADATSSRREVRVRSTPA